MKIRSIVAVVVLFVAVAALAQGAAPSDLKAPDAAQFVGQPKDLPLTGDRLVQRTHEVASLIRCPVCQGMSIADSPSEMAVNMKEQVRELLARGYGEEQILKYFELSYGQFVLLKPKFKGITGMVWVLPVLALLAGVAIVFFKLRKLEQPVEPAVSAEPETPILPPAETADPYLARVRELVSGGKE